jgi:hypothetical protein
MDLLTFTTCTIEFHNPIFLLTMYTIVIRKKKCMLSSTLESQSTHSLGQLTRLSWSLTLVGKQLRNTCQTKIFIYGGTWIFQMRFHLLLIASCSLLGFALNDKRSILNFFQPTLHWQGLATTPYSIALELSNKQCETVRLFKKGSRWVGLSILDPSYNQFRSQRGIGVPVPILHLCPALITYLELQMLCHS